MGDIGVPASPHWVNFDDTDPPGDWFPRRADWPTFLNHPDIPKAVQGPHGRVRKVGGRPNPDERSDAPSDDHAGHADDRRAHQAGAVRALANEARVRLLGRQEGPGLHRRRHARTWMDIAKADPQAPVYVESAGAAVFTSICYNCHGEQADSKGLLADEISVFTGGAARVANFRDGLFGPVSNPGGNRTGAFSPTLQAIGGGATRRRRGGPVHGIHGPRRNQQAPAQRRPRPGRAVTRARAYCRTNAALAGTPDMLRLGLQLCQQIALASPGREPAAQRPRQ